MTELFNCSFIHCKESYTSLHGLRKHLKAHREKKEYTLNNVCVEIIKSSKEVVKNDYDS